MPDIIKLGKTMKRHLNGILKAIKSGINSDVVEGLNNKITTAFKRSYGIKAEKYRDTIIYLVAEVSVHIQQTYEILKIQLL